MYIDKLFNLKNKVAVITGAGGHLCSEMAITLARAGCKLALRLKNRKVKVNSRKN